MPLFNPTQVSVTLPSPEPTNKAIASTINASTTNVLLVSSSYSRKGLTIWNNSSSNLYIDYASDVSASYFAIKILPNGSYELPYGYTGEIHGIWDAATGQAFIREFQFFDLSSQ